MDKKGERGIVMNHRMKLIGNQILQLRRRTNIQLRNINDYEFAIAPPLRKQMNNVEEL